MSRDKARLFHDAVQRGQARSGYIVPSRSLNKQTMQSASAGSRSRFGCATCRRRHRKCDEQRPVCTPCQSRDLDCGYQMPLKWTNVGSIDSFETHMRRRSKTAKRGAVHAVRPGPAPASPLSTGREPQSDHEVSLEMSSHSGSVDFSEPQSMDDGLSQKFGQGAVPALTPLLAQQPQTYLELGSISDHIFSSRGTPPSQTRQPRWRDEWESLATNDIDQGYSTARHDQQSLHDSGYTDKSSCEAEYDQVSDSASCQDVSSSPGSSPWVMNSSLGNLLYQIFKNPGEEIVFSYYLKRVCSCIPAYDGDHNPWRKLALVALSYPVLLHGILSVSTGHMYNYGRSNESLLSSRQSRALSSLRIALDTLQRARDQEEGSGVEADTLFNGGGVFSVLSAREVAFAAIMTQTSSVLMMGIGNVEVHMKCALHFIQDLGYLHGPATSIFSRLLVQRFAMVDVVLAHLRFRRPLAPLEFFMYRDNEHVDHTEPSFREMHGCPQRVLCFLAQISALSADLMTAGSSQAQIQAKAYALETRMRVWGEKYYDKMIDYDDDGSWSSPTLTSSHQRSPTGPYDDLETVCECFYWTAHILLQRRVFLDPTKSTRVQLIRRHIFCLMDRLVAGCGPDSSLPFPFYMAAREAVTLEERDWVRRKHRVMMETYRDRSRDYMMTSTEKIWDKAAATDGAAPGEEPLWDTPLERFIRETDSKASYFMF